MFGDDEDERTLRATVVHPNDILDIEVSASVLTHSLPGADEQPKSDSKTKQREKKSVKLGAPIRTAAMKRGDPFLPSVFSDENPIADYTMKKNSRKKPSDCKCKGFGYNVSPSALLPEEMRQQWRVGMFGKPTLTKTGAVAAGGTASASVVMMPVPKDCDLKCNQVNINRNGAGCSSSKCVLRCKNCRDDPCLCTDMSSSLEGFRIPDSCDRKKQKTVPKSVCSFKPKDKSPNPVIIGNTSTPMIKRIPCYNSKENTNIISTSNFHRTPLESQSSHNVSITESPSFKSGHATSFVGTRSINPTEAMPCKMKSFNNAPREDVSVTPRARHRHQPLPSRRILANISPSPIMTSSSLSGGPGSYDRKKTLSRSTPQMLMMGSQGCACDSCRRRVSLMSRMEALGFSSSHAQQMLSPFLFTSAQRYQPVLMQSPMPATNRYAPYTVPSYSYSRAPGGIYRSPERYQCSSPTYYDYSDISSYRRQPFIGTSLSMANEINKIESSFLDSENSLPSPPSTGYVEDITDLSIQDTVDFFVSMRSPFVNSSPSPVSDSSPGVYSALSPLDRCASPSFPSGPLSCFCSIGSNNSTPSFSIPQYKRDSGFVEPSSLGTIKYGTNNDVASQPISLLYSSLVSDLEDELQCAIENIPTV